MAIKYRVRREDGDPSKPLKYLATLRLLREKLKRHQPGKFYRFRAAGVDLGPYRRRLRVLAKTAYYVKRMKLGDVVWVEGPNEVLYSVRAVDVNDPKPEPQEPARPTEPPNNWVTQIGDYKVIKRESKRPGGSAYRPIGSNLSFCVHTTEGSTVDGAWSTLNSKGAAPHFIIGEGKIVQCRPLNAQAATLVADRDDGHPNDRFIQVESVGFSSLKLHNLTPETFEPLVALTKFLHERMGIPLHRPDGWADQLPSGVWATNNTRRQSGRALTERGVFGHIDVPNQDPTWHWDPGSLNYAELFKRAGG